MEWDQKCHCGLPVTYGYDDTPSRTWGLCVACEFVRCDANPADCPAAQTTEWGLRYGDGEVIGPFDTEGEAQMWMDADRASIAAGHWDSRDYEPMKIVSRKVIYIEWGWMAK